MIDFKKSMLFNLKESTSPMAHEVTAFMIEGEEFLGSFQAIRDYVVFTSKRIIAVNVKGVTGKQRDYTSIPYSQIQTFSIQTSGVMDADSELFIWIAEIGKIRFEFSGKVNITAIAKSISECTL